MKEIRLNKNQELHLGNIFEEFFAHLKAPSLGALVFKRVQGKFNYLACNLEAEQTFLLFGLSWST